MSSEQVPGQHEESLKDYEVFEKLSRHGERPIYRGQFRSTGLPVAIKVRMKSASTPPEIMKRLSQEVEIHRKLEHPFILKLYTCFIETSFIYLVLELDPGVILKTIMSRNRSGLEENFASYILAHVSKGLEYLESQKIIHRDLTLMNILVTHKKKVKITNFKHSVKLNESDETNEAMSGDLNFTSPELAAKLNHGFPTDKWSLGCILYALLVGEPPFSGKNYMQKFDNVNLVNFQIPAGISNEAGDLINRLIIKNPAQRLSITEIINHCFLTESIRSLGFRTDHNDQSTGQINPEMETRPSSSGAQFVAGVESEVSGPETAACSSSTVHKSDTSECKNEEHSDQRILPDMQSVPKFAVPPICTARLSPTSRFSDTVKYRICEDGSVRAHFNWSHNQVLTHTLIFVYVISKDGKTINLYNAKRDISLFEPLPTGPNSFISYSYNNLPLIHWDKYVQIAVFVNTIRAVTSKIILDTEYLTCHYMENLTDFHAFFHHGLKIDIVSNRTIITDKHGHQMASLEECGLQYKSCIEHFQLCVKKCLAVHYTMKKMEDKYFPFRLMVPSNEL